jgi:uncharacterized membrane protein
LGVLRYLFPAFVSYVLSFVYVGVYWNNHHHLLHAVKHVSGMTLWANLHLLFWITLIPFVTGWVGETEFAVWPVAVYGVVLLASALSWQLLVRVLVKHHGPGSALSTAIGRGRKEWLSTGLYAVGIAVAVAGHFVQEMQAWSGVVAFLIYAVVAGIWFVPDKRIEGVLRERGEGGE